jgi:tetratricopeptide (TPR) repeat protein
MAAYEAALQIYRAIHEPLGEASVLLVKGRMALRMNDLPAAREAHEAALQIYRAIDDRLGELNVLHIRGDLALRIADLQGAVEAYGAALQIARAIGMRLDEGNALRGLGIARLLLDEGEPEELSASAAIAESIGDSYGLWVSRTAMAAISDPAIGVPELGRAQAYFASAGFTWEAVLARALERLLLDDAAGAGDVLRSIPAGEPAAAVISGLSRRAALRRLLQYLPIA